MVYNPAMKEFLYLYPIHKFAGSIIGSRWSNPAERTNIYRRLNEIISYRYRENGYQINWLMFNNFYDHSKPDLTLASQELIAPEDKLILAGITFDDLVLRKTYADPAVILTQINSSPEQLVITGFHLWDCVDKIAEKAYHAGISTIVDEDLTELYFWAYYSSKPILLERQTKLNIPPNLVEYTRSRRVNKPWLIQV